MTPRAVAGRLAPWLLGAVLALSLAACGGGSGSSVAGGGIGGTGKGTVTAVTPVTLAPASVGTGPAPAAAPASAPGSAPLAGSPGNITLNSTRTFTTNGSTQFFLDDGAVADTQIANLPENGKGLVARVDVGDDVSADFSSGTALRVTAEHTLIGPVTSVSPLTVLGQPVLVTNNTVLPITLNPAALQPGDIVAVSGNTDAGGVIQATRLETWTAPNAPWRLIGTVTALPTSTSLSIGDQTVDFNGFSPQDCNGGVQPGNVVKIKAAADATYLAALPTGGLPPTLGTTTSIECVRAGLDVPAGVSGGTLQVELEGFVGANLNSTDFTVDGQTVHTTSGTTYGEGNAADVLPGVRVEVVGTLDLASGVLTATQVEFSEQRARLVATLDAYQAGVSLTILGVPVQITPMTQVDPGVLNGALVEVDAFWDGSTAFATDVKIVSPGTPIGIQGPVTSVDTAQLQFTVLGAIVVDVTNIVDLEGSAEGTQLTPTDFINLLNSQPNVLVDIEDATFTNGTLTGASKISIED